MDNVRRDLSDEQPVHVDCVPRRPDVGRRRVVRGGVQGQVHRQVGRRALAGAAKDEARRSSELHMGVKPKRIYTFQDLL